MDSDEPSYTLVHSRSIAELTEKVHELMAAGWRPLGGPIASAQQEEGFAPFAILIQAMVRGSC